MAGRTLTPEEAGRVYDRIGRFQDWQGFYEAPAARELEAQAAFESSGAVFELGCGTGAYAQRLLDGPLPSEAVYRGVDVSSKMVGLASGRLRRFGERAGVELVSGRPPLPGPDHSFDRFLAIYVFDLLAVELAAGLLDEAHRLLTGDGLLCLVGLAQGETKTARAVSSLWEALWRRSPSLVGGCRPIDVSGLLDDRWQLAHVQTVTAWAITSQVVVAQPGTAGQK